MSAMEKRPGPIARLRKRSSRTKGAGTRASCPTKAMTPRIEITATAARTEPDKPLPRVKITATANSDSVKSAMPIRSNPTGLCPPVASDGNRARPTTRVMPPMAAMTAKTAGQPKPAINAPPSEGPSAVPTADTVPSSPIALPVRSFGTRSPTIAMVSAIMTAAPRP